MLESLGYQAITAGNGRRALELVATAGSTIDLVILDLIMPDMTGWEALREFKESPSLQDIPVVIISVVAGEQAIEARDARDTSRSVAPLLPAEDAISIDTTQLTINEVVNQVLERANKL